MRKAELEQLCKTLGLPHTGNKAELQKRICAAVSGGTKLSAKSAARTLASLIRARDAKKLAAVAADAKEMYEDDAEIDSIRKAILRIHGVRVNRADCEAFVEIVDAANKKDYEYIEENVEAWRSAGRAGVSLAEAHAAAARDKRLAEALG